MRSIDNNFTTDQASGVIIVLLIQLIQFCFVWTKIISSTLTLYMITSFSQHTVMYISVKKKNNMINMDTLKTYFFLGGHTSNVTIIKVHSSFL